MLFNHPHYSNQSSGSCSCSGPCSCSGKSHDSQHSRDEGECFIQHIPELLITQNGFIPTVPTPIFKDFTNNHFKLLIRIRAEAIGGATANIIFTPRCGPSFSEPLVGGILQVTDKIQIFEVEDIARIEVQASAANTVFIPEGRMWKTFCICCSDNQGKCNNC
jgi:hypothetical protein